MNSSSRTNSVARVRLGGFEVDIGRACLIGPDNKTIRLRPKAWDALFYLIQNSQRIVTRDELLHVVWPDLFVTDHSLSVCIAEIRRALGSNGINILRTIPRKGYIIEVDNSFSTSNVPRGKPEYTAPRPVLAVLPFANFTGERRWDRLCDGLVEDMITDFSRHPDLSVIARTSSFAWRDRAADIREIGRALGADYLLEGSIQTDGGQVGVTAQLIDAASGTHIWASRYKREEEAVFAIQAEVVGRVVGTLAGFGGAIARSELSRVHRKPPATMHAYELYLLGYEEEARLDRDGTLRGIELLEAALREDPGLSRAWTVLGFAFANAAANGWTDDPNAMRGKQRDAIRRAVELDPLDAVALEEAGAMLARQGDLAGARDAFERAAEAGSSHADALALLGKYMVEVLDQSDTAERMMARAFELNPFAPPWYFLGATRVAYFSQNFAEAAELALRAPPLRLPRLFRVLALAQLSLVSEARTAAIEYFERFGPDAARGALAGLPPLCTNAQRLLDDGLKKANLWP